ncbi:MAG TPA: hypothetical protein VFX65_01475 [Candidatus Limnocylindrales bacterium]|nr:hypothetical protein [Candidatus Limnocylindrales bacterium]
MIGRETVAVWVAVATLVVPIVFLAILAVAWWRRNRGLPIGPLDGLLAAAGGGSLGTMVLMAGTDFLVGLPLYVVAGLVAVDRWRRRRRVQAGMFVAGVALPWTILWGFYVLLLVTGEMPFVAEVTWAGFLGGALVVGIGAAAALSGDPLPPAPDPAAAAGDPGSRRVGTIAAAILEPTRLGPFRVPDVAALVAIAVSWTVIGFLPFPNRVIGLGLAIVVGAVVATEAYIRAMPGPSRRAFEAFSWLGEHELAQARAQTGTPVPTSKRAAEAWLDRHPETPETGWIRAEVLVLAERPADAHAVAERMPAGTAAERFWRASALDLADWARGGPGAVAAMEAELEGLGPEGSDERLRGEVAIAASRVRMATDAGLPADGSAGLLAPLIAVRERLGHRADGQVGRALRKRMIPAFLLVGLVFGAAMELLLTPMLFGSR